MLNLSKFIQRLQRKDILAFLARGAGIAFFIKVLSVGLNYLVHVFLTRWLGPGEYGVYAYVLSWVALLAIISGLGFPTAVLRFIPQYNANKDWGRFNGIINVSRWLTLFASLIPLLIGAVILLWGNIFNKVDYLYAIILGLCMVPLLALVNLQTGIARGVYKVTLAFAPSQLIRPLLILGGSYLLIQKGHALTSIPVIGTEIFALFIVFVMQIYLFRRGISEKILSTRRVYQIREWICVSLPLLVVAGFVEVLNKTDVLIIGMMLSPNDVGIYNATIKTVRLTSFVLVAVNAVAAPMFASLYAEGKRDELQRLVSALAHWIFWPSLVFAFILIIFAEFILGFFGPQFVSAKWVLLVLVLGQLINAGAGSVGYLMNLTGYQNQSARVVLYTVLFNLFGNVIGIKLLGILGAAIATSITMAIWNIWLHALVVKNLKVQPSILHAFILKQNRG